MTTVPLLFCLNRDIPYNYCMKKLIILFLFVGVFASCQKNETANTTPDDEYSQVNKGLKVVNMAVSSKTFEIEVADTEESRMIGLMNRKSMPENHGMIFVFDKDEKMNFWMKNTLIPLDIAYISKDGTILEIHQGKPLSEASITGNYYARYALELNAGTFEKNGIKVGDKVDLSVLTK